MRLVCDVTCALKLNLRPTLAVCQCASGQWPVTWPHCRVCLWALEKNLAPHGHVATLAVGVENAPPPGPRTAVKWQCVVNASLIKGQPVERHRLAVERRRQLATRCDALHHLNDVSVRIQAAEIEGLAALSRDQVHQHVTVCNLAGLDGVVVLRRHVQDR